MRSVRIEHFGEERVSGRWWDGQGCNAWKYDSYMCWSARQTIAHTEYREHTKPVIVATRPDIPSFAAIANTAFIVRLLYSSGLLALSHETDSL